MNNEQRQEDDSRDGTGAGEREVDDAERGHSLSGQVSVPQPKHDNSHDLATDVGDRISAHVVLYQPEIPQNTGNIGRTCVAVRAKLWIVQPAGFRIDDTKLRRAGLDYWQYLDRGDAVNWEDLKRQIGDRRMFFFSRFATRTIWDAEFQPDDVFVFGRETSGLPDSILDPHDPNALRLPTSQHVRSLNLATTVGIVLYEHQRQIRASNRG